MVAVGAEYLRIIAWGTVASGIVFVNGSMFQAMGNTVPPLIASFVRILVVAIPAILLARECRGSSFAGSGIYRSQRRSCRSA